MGSEVSTQQLRSRHQQPSGLNRSNSGPTVSRSTSADHILTRDSSLDSNLAFNVVSGLSRPIGATVPFTTDTRSTGSGTESKFRSSGSVPSIPKEIVIVSRGETESEDQKFTFPPPFKPLIPIGHESLTPGSIQINPTGLINTGLILEHQLKYKSDFIANQQLVLIDIIREIDSFTNYNCAILSDSLNKFSKLGANFSKLAEIETLIQKIESQLKVSLTRIQLLNSALPREEQLEPFSPRLIPSSPTK